MTQEPGTLRPDEHHPAADDALAWLNRHFARKPEAAFRLLEAFSSTSIEGNRLAEVCAETLRRVLAREPVSDRYLLGLVWTIRQMEEASADNELVRS
jgi:hypothetical protein